MKHAHIPAQARQNEAPAEKKWAPWKQSLFVIVFCGAFWVGVIWLWNVVFG